ncbi:MAG: polyketide synthase dehydratase domain-containing protein [Gemmatimonadota bacterium]|nr:polyketide synthase dehydratase domain-containing protein [Gemmatimonadota bacterium]
MKGREALLGLSLPAEFRADLESFRLHPALLDKATAGAQHLFEELGTGEGALVPVGYGAVRMMGAFQPEMTSHVTLKEIDEAGTFAGFDVLIYDREGAPLAAIRDFSMMRVTQE